MWQGTCILSTSCRKIIKMVEHTCVWPEIKWRGSSSKENLPVLILKEVSRDTWVIISVILQPSEWNVTLYKHVRMNILQGESIRCVAQMKLTDYSLAWNKFLLPNVKEQWSFRTAASKLEYSLLDTNFISITPDHTKLQWRTNFMTFPLTLKKSNWWLTVVTSGHLSDM